MHLNPFDCYGQRESRYIRKKNQASKIRSCAILRGSVQYVLLVEPNLLGNNFLITKYFSIGNRSLIFS